MPALLPSQQQRQRRPACQQQRWQPSPQACLPPAPRAQALSPGQVQPQAPWWTCPTLRPCSLPLRTTPLQRREQRPPQQAPPLGQAWALPQAWPPPPLAWPPRQASPPRLPFQGQGQASMAPPPSQALQAYPSAQGLVLARPRQRGLAQQRVLALPLALPRRGWARGWCPALGWASTIARGRQWRQGWRLRVPWGAQTQRAWRHLQRSTAAGTKNKGRFRREGGGG